MLADTIAAIATAQGAAAIGIVRLSGPEAMRVADGVFKASRPQLTLADAPSHHMIRGVVTSVQGEVLDDCLAVAMRKPRSYTGEDMVEIHCHGSPVILRAVLASCLANGARTARAGEFTRRAFVNGKLDLVQVEAVGDLLTAQGEAGAILAVQHLEGRLSQRCLAMRESLIAFLAHVHASIDYPDEVPEVVPDHWMQQVKDMLGNIKALLNEAESGIRLREGVDAVLIGRPNVGKSSLLNALLRTARAIVTDVAGTTRDVIEESLVIGGVPFRLSDTAGLRETHDVVESEGVNRTRQKLQEADVLLGVFDSSQPLTADDSDVLEMVRHRGGIAVWNKSDLPVVLDAQDFTALQVVRVSARQGQGIDVLESAMARVAGVDEARRYQQEGHVLLNRPRQVGALQGVAHALQRVLDGVDMELAPDCLAADVEEALWHLGELTGETTPDDVVDEIFRRFCVGK